MKELRKGNFGYRLDVCSSCGRQQFNATAERCWFCSATRVRPVAAPITVILTAPRADEAARSLKQASTTTFDFAGGLVAGLAVVILPFIAALSIQI